MRKLRENSSFTFSVEGNDNGKFNERIQERHVCAAITSKVVHFSEGVHCFFK